MKLHTLFAVGLGKSILAYKNSIEPIAKRMTNRSIPFYSIPAISQICLQN